MKLEVGMYVRHDGRIFKLDEYNIKGWKKFFEIVGTDNFQASNNIIDLIEVGDFVNGYKVYYCYCADEDSTGLYIDTEKGRVWLDKPSQIKSIVTKESFSQMEYKVVE